MENVLTITFLYYYAFVKQKYFHLDYSRNI